MIRAPLALAVLLTGIGSAEAGRAQAAEPAAPPAQAPTAQAPTQAPAQTAADDGLGPAYAYCATLFATLRKEEPAMVSGISPTVDAALQAEADRRAQGWSLGFDMKSAQMHGAADARQLVGKTALIDRLTPRKDEREVGTEFARCWAVVQPWLKPGGAAKPATR